MMTGALGTFVFSWSQTETDGVAGAPLGLLTEGASWRWAGAAVRIEGASDLLRLEGAEGMAMLRARAGRVVRRLAGAAFVPPGGQDRPEAGGQGFAVTDGQRVWDLALVRAGSGEVLAVAAEGLPPAGRELWVTRVTPVRASLPEAQGMICFTPGTSIATCQGPRRVETLRPGDMVLTRDDGPQPVIWAGHRRLSGARLHVTPGLRPVRIRAAALGADPQPDLVVSPHHRVLVTGPAARALFNTSEVLVRAEDLVNDLTIGILRGLREVTYLHLLFERHQLIWANGLLTESFHPGMADFVGLEADQRAGLRAVLPGQGPESYGPQVRRALSAPEAAILRHDLSIWARPPC